MNFIELVITFYCKFNFLKIVVTTDRPTDTTTDRASIAFKTCYIS